MKKSNLALIALLSVCLIISGCSFSRSSKHSSKSSSSPSRSSSGKSQKSVEKVSNSYQEDVAALSILYVGSAGSALDFQRELSEVSSKHGIVDWENNPGTFRAIGVGLKRARVSKDSLQTLPFLQGVSNSHHYSQILAGFK